MNNSLKTELVEILTNLAMKHDERAIILMNSQGAHFAPETTKGEVDSEQAEAKYIRQVIERVREA